MKPYWPYRYEDKTTWKYIDHIIGGSDKKPYVKKWILNPDFAYARKDPKRGK